MTAAHPQILMCPPDYYGIEYEINPWMSRQRQADRELAIEQWEGLVAVLSRLGVEILLLTPAQGLPDLVFTANAALIYRRRAVLSHFRHTQRQGEEPLCRRVVQANMASPSSIAARRSILRRGGRRSVLRRHALRRLSHSQRRPQPAAGSASCSTVEVIPLELVDAHYYHLDTCFCPLAAGRGDLVSQAFDDYGRRATGRAIPTLIPVAARRSPVVRVQRRGRRQTTSSPTPAARSCMQALSRPRLHVRTKRRYPNSSKPAAARSA